jgi:hypothetical protein
MQPARSSGTAARRADKIFMKISPDETDSVGEA